MCRVASRSLNSDWSRATFPHRRLRSHSLPQSKRYPEDDAELETVLRRHSVAARETLGDDEPCRIITPLYEAALIGRAML